MLILSHIIGSDTISLRMTVAGYQKNVDTVFFMLVSKLILAKILDLWYIIGR